MGKDLLKEYNRKRDFKVTKEPGGRKVSRAKSKKLVFVVQEHHARRLHYDFRLELEGVLKSWAVPKGPSLDPSDKRLAVQTEDHPLEYAKFHGTIPEGEYGAGEVFIWDSGTWEPEGDDPIGDLARGHLKFRLTGKKLRGSFVLIRTAFRSDGTKKNWLLIKHHEEAAVPRRKASREVAKKKSPPLATDPWPGFVEPQLPRLVAAVPAQTGGWIHELKFDGYRMQAHLRNGVVRFLSRNNIDWSNRFPLLLNAVEALPATTVILDGEVVSLDARGRSDFQRLQNSLKLKNDRTLRYYVFDVLYLDGRDLRGLPLVERKEILKRLLRKARPGVVLSEDFPGAGAEIFRVSCEHELEGIVSKRAASPYTSGRGDLWVKTKCSRRQEFVIGGWTGLQGGRPGIGALLLGVFEDGELRYSGRVGTGFDVATLRELRKLLGAIEVAESPFAKNSPRGKGIHWVTPTRVCEVSFSNWTNEGILRAPVFRGLRDDKPAEEIQMERARGNCRKAKLSLTPVREISSPDKILFPEEGLTKKDVDDYYQAVAAVMLPYVSDRPLSLVRCPNGAAGGCFFQKHISGIVPKAFRTFPVKEERGEGIYLAIDSPEGLRELVQLNAFELHAGNCHRTRQRYPDQVVMDFDPGPGISWAEVVAAAFELRELLADLDLKSFVKLTGGKGLHVHVPIAPVYDWEQVKAFAQTLALELVKRRPEKYTANMSKKVRKGRIFVDYLRNGHGATAVAPYSLRAKPRSAVALPLDWKELRRIPGPQEFTLPKALRKIRARKADPWQELRGLSQEIAILVPVAGTGKRAA
jgi:bifunctional non-homologous end joining protein LigD